MKPGRALSCWSHGPAAARRAGLASVLLAVLAPQLPAFAPPQLTVEQRLAEDWRWRMVTPTRGDWESVPMTPEAQAVADKWDPKTEPASEQCKSYGAPALMRTPTRLNITWQDDNTLRVDTAAPERDILAELALQFRRVHAGRADLHRVDDVAADLDEIADHGADRVRGRCHRPDAGPRRTAAR